MFALQKILNGMDMIQLDFLLRLIIGCLCGFIIGRERQRRQKDAGVRTHIMVALASTLMMIVSKYAFYDVIISDSISLDASRIAANIITGISFLCAGVIFIKNDFIKGLTTAAGLWTTSGVGLAIGAGMYGIGISATIIILFVQILTHRSSGMTADNSPISKMTLVVENDMDAMEEISKLFTQKNIYIQNSKIKENEDNTLTIQLLVHMNRNNTLTEPIELLKSHPFIKSVKM